MTFLDLSRRSATARGVAAVVTYIGLTCPAGLACSRGAPRALSGFVNAPTSAVASQMAGRVSSLLVEEGEAVQTGDVLAELDSAERQALVAQARANLERAHQALRAAEANLRATVPTARGAGADIVHAEAAANQARIDFERTRRLVAAHAIAPAELDAARSNLEQTEATLTAMLAARSEARGRIGTAAAQVADARAAVASSEAALEYAEAQLAQTRITSPFGGIVVDIDLRPGEWASPGTPVVTVEDVAHRWVRLDVEETRFSHLALGVPARIRLMALPGVTFRGHVIEIGAEGDFAINRDVKRGHPDIRTFRVRVAFDGATNAVRSGMTAEVELEVPPAPAASSSAPIGDRR